MVSVKEIQIKPVVRVARIVVFVPGQLQNMAVFARQVYLMALAQQRQVLYLALKCQERDALAADRQLATLAALTRDESVTASELQVQALDLTDALRQVTQPGDLVIWPEERLLAPAGLEKELRITQYALPAVYAPSAAGGRSWLRQAVFWLAGLVILAGFSFLEVRVSTLMGGAAGKAGIVMLFLFELAAFFAWDRFFG